MAVTHVQDHTSGTSGSGTAIAATLAGDVPTGRLLVAWFGFDNTSATAPTINSVSKPGGESNSWAQVASHNSSNATSAAGVRGEMWAILTSTTWTSGTTVTGTLSASPPKSTVTLREFSGALETLRGTSGTGTSTGGTPSAATSGTALVAGDLVLGGATFETSSTPTADSDTTNGTWDTGIIGSATGGATAVQVRSIQQYKIVTAAGVQTYNPTANSDSGAAVASFQFNPAVPATITAVAANATADAPPPTVDTGRPFIVGVEALGAQGATAVVPTPAGWQLGDHLIALVSQDEDGSLVNMSIPAAFTVADTLELPVGGGALQCGWLQPAATPAANYTFNVDSASGDISILLLVRNASDGDPFRVAPDIVGTDAPVGTTHTLPSVNANADDLLVGWFVRDPGGNISEYSTTPPTGMTLLTRVVGSSGGWNRAAIYYQTLASTGATGTRSAEYSFSGGRYEAGALLAVAMVAAAGSVTVDAVPAGASADAPTPAVVSADAVTIVAVVAAATADAPPPAVTAGDAVAVTAVAASASADAPIPAVSAGGPPPVRTRRLVIHLSPVA